MNEIFKTIYIEFDSLGVLTKFARFNVPNNDLCGNASTFLKKIDFTCGNSTNNFNRKKEIGFFFAVFSEYVQ